MFNRMLFMTTGILIALMVGSPPIPSLANPPKSKVKVDARAGKKPKVRRILASYARTYPQDLYGETTISDVIVIGRFTKLLRTCPTPLDSHPYDDYWSYNHTVYNFQVERFLKGSGGKDLKINYLGGEVEGILDIFEFDSHPLMGERYLLFLKSHANSKLTKKYGYIPIMTHGRWGKAADADELTLTLPYYDQIMLRSGVTQCVGDENHPKLKPKIYSSGNQIIGVTENQAVDSVTKALAQEEFDKNRFIGK